MDGNNGELATEKHCFRIDNICCCDITTAYLVSTIFLCIHVNEIHIILLEVCLTAILDDGAMQDGPQKLN